jgi:hypothetical protein
LRDGIKDANGIKDAMRDGSGDANGIKDAMGDERWDRSGLRDEMRDRMEHGIQSETDHDARGCGTRDGPVMG